MALPRRCQVLVVGGGLAGCTTAALLAEGGADVLLVEARDGLGDGASGRDAGLCLLGLDEPPQRLIEALGLKIAREIYAFTEKNLALVAQTGLLERTGRLIQATGHELPELGPAEEALGALGVAVQARGDDSLYLPQEGQTDPGRLIEALSQRAEAAGARLVTGVTATSLDARGAGLHLVTDQGAVAADAIVLACGAGLRSLDAWFDDKILTARVSDLLFDGPFFDTPGTTLQGYTWWRSAAGRTLLGGCRWATPHLELGETDDAAVAPKVEAALRAFASRSFPALAERPVLRARSAIVAMTCDGLPLLGPVPGRPTVLACAGWNGRDLGLAMAGAAAVASGLLTGTNEDAPALFGLGRFN